MTITPPATADLDGSRAGFSIWIVTPPGYVHSRCFEEVALALSEAFAVLGFAAPVVTDPARVEGTPVVLGANLIGRIAGPTPPRMILYNLEQVHAGSAWFEPAYVELLRRFPVWDYSVRNIRALAERGVAASLCSVGYSPGLTRIPHALMQDIDVAFFGSENPRRIAVLQALQRGGLKVHAAVGVYGAERDALLARSKIVLNLHFHEAQVFEIVRVSYLLANKLCVVSEIGFDRDLEAPFAKGVAFAAYGELVAACRFLLQRPDARRRIAQAGFEAFKAMDQAPRLKAALDALPAAYAN
ncbi:MAG: type 12 methyltransferase [Caulobacteraceae bacterium]|nr:type 12 methyltransferase [Caulobacteraceae bacterium]